MSLTIPIYSYPRGQVYSPRQLEKFIPEENPTGPVDLIATEPADLISTDAKERERTSQEGKGAALLLVFSILSMTSLLSSHIGHLTSYALYLHKNKSSMDNFACGKNNVASAWLDLIVSWVSLAGIIVKHPIGLGIGAGHEALLNGYALGSSLWKGDLRLTLENSLFLANNSLYIAALFYCSLEIAFISLALQMLVLSYKAYQEIRKGTELNAVIGITHAIIACARFMQTVNLFELLRVKWLAKADIEVWREELSHQEHAIQESLGMKYLYFKKDDKREKFLILSAQSDHNGAMSIVKGRFAAQIGKLSERFDVKFRTISKIEDIKTEIEFAAQTGRVTGLMLRAHGDAYSMEFGSDPVSGVLDTDTIHSGLFSKLDPQCVIILGSCRTAEVPNYGIAYEIASQSERVTYAADKSISASDYRLASLNPLEWRFDGRGEDKTKFIIPNPRP